MLFALTWSDPVRASRLLLAFGLLALVGLMGSGQAMACDHGIAAPADAAQGSSTSSPAGPCLVMAERLGWVDHPHHHHHPVPHPIDHGCPDGCCTCFFGAGTPHVLLPGSAILDLPVAGAYMATYSAGAVKTAACPPFRPPRTV